MYLYNSHAMEFFRALTTSGQHLVNKKQCSRQLQCEVPCGVGNVVDSSLSSLSSPQGGSSGGGGPAGGGGRGHFIHLAIYCTTTWGFALKGLRTSQCGQWHSHLCHKRHHPRIRIRPKQGHTSVSLITQGLPLGPAHIDPNTPPVFCRCLARRCCLGSALYCVDWAGASTRTCPQGLP